MREWTGWRGKKKGGGTYEKNELEMENRDRKRRKNRESGLFSLSMGFFFCIRRFSPVKHIGVQACFGEDIGSKLTTSTVTAYHVEKILLEVLDFTS